MRILKWLGGLLAIYVVFVVIFEAGYLGMMQPSFEEGGIPMLLLTTTDERGEEVSKMLARFLMGFPPPRDILRLDLVPQ